MTVLACTLAVGCGSSGSQPSETEETVSEETADTAEDTASEETAGTTEDTALEETADAAEDTGSEPPAVSLEDGVYTAEFDTDSGMFHVSEACDGKGTLTVQDGAMTIHVSLASKNIVNLYPGLAEDAQKEGESGKHKSLGAEEHLLYGFDRSFVARLSFSAPGIVFDLIHVTPCPFLYPAFYIRFPYLFFCIHKVVLSHKL